MGLLVAQPLGERRRALDVDQHEHALLAHRLMVAPEQEVVEGAPTDHPAHLQEFRDHQEDDESEHRVAQQRQAEVVEAGALEAVQETEDRAVQDKAGDETAVNRQARTRTARAKLSRLSQAPLGP
jgi:hypothetical protein